MDHISNTPLPVLAVSLKHWYLHEIKYKKVKMEEKKTFLSNNIVEKGRV
jgi:hypothetical protein